MTHTNQNFKIFFIIAISCILSAQCLVNPILSASQYHLTADEPEMPWSQVYSYIIDFNDCLIVEIEEDGYLIACTSEDTWPTGLIIRINSSGSVQWSQNFGLASKVEIEGILKCQDGGFATIGRSLSPGHDGAGFVWLTRLAENGTVLWQREYDDCYWGTDIKECQDGGFILTASEPDIIRTDANGVILWNYTSDWYRCHAGSVIECDNGDFVCTGGMALADSYYDAFLIRLNGSGHVLWDETYNYDALDIGNDLIQCDDGGFAIAGESGSYNYYPRGFWFLRTYGNGTVLFEESYFNGDARSIVQCPDGGFALAGIYTPSADYSEWDAAFVRTDAVGNELWTSFCTGPSETRAHSLIFNNESGYVVSGWAEWDVEVTTDNETIIYGGHLPFLWRLDVNATDTVILSLDETNTTATDVTTTTETTSETTTTTTTTTETTSVTTTTEVTTTSSTTTSATNTTQSQLFDTNLVMIVGLSSGVIVIVIFCVGVKALRPSRS